LEPKVQPKVYKFICAEGINTERINTVGITTRKVQWPGLSFGLNSLEGLPQVTAW